MSWANFRRTIGLHLAVIGMVTAAVAAGAVMAAADEPQIIGATTRLDPEVGAHHDGADRTLVIGSHVYKNDLLWTGKSGKLRVELKDGTVLTLGEKAKVALDDFVYEESGGTVALALRSVAGAFRFIGGEIDKRAPGATKIETPLATLTIRGTDIFAGPIDGAYGVFVFSGQVEVATDAGSVSLGAGDGTMLTSRQAAPGPVKHWPAGKIKRAVDLTGL